jgi:hypothetical protein
MVHDRRSAGEGDKGAVHLVILVEILQETLVDRVEVCDEEIVHGSIMAHHDGSRSAPSLSPPSQVLGFLSSVDVENDRRKRHGR